MPTLIPRHALTITVRPSVPNGVASVFLNKIAKQREVWVSWILLQAAANFIGKLPKMWWKEK
jgi:hypothetical protein